METASRSRVGGRAARRELVAEVLDLHAAGLSPSRIAAKLGMTPARAQRLLAEGIAGLPEQDVDDLRATSEIRLDRLAATYGELLTDADPRIRLQAAQGMATVERDRARLLGTWQRPPKDPTD